MRNVTARRLSVLRTPALAAFALLGTAPMLLAAPPKPPVSDGSSGSWSAQIGNGVYNSFNTDTGLVEGCNATQCTYQTTLTFKTGTYDGKAVHIFNFTDIDIASYNPAMTVYGSTPALFLANQGISIGIPMQFYNGGGAAGAAAPDTPKAPGGNGGGKGHGFGGVGQGGETTGCGGILAFTGSGGGGGGNHSAGTPGLTNFYPPAGAGTNPDFTPGRAGHRIPKGLNGGGGGAGGGGGGYEGDFYTTLGGAGGGAVVFGSTSTIDITASGNVGANGNPGQVQSASAGSGGGGAGGTLYFFAPSGFTNEGLLTVQGGAGGANMINTFTPDCQNYEMLPGPNGGNGSGGSLVVKAPKITNAGTIDVAGGGGAANGGGVTLLGKVTERGTIIGAK
jgi:hypothetical protein